MLVVIGALAMAALVFLTRPERAQNRLLAAYLTLEAFTFLLLSVLPTWATTERTAYALLGTGYLVWPWVMVLYLLFLSTLDTPLVAPLRRRSGRGAVVMAGVALSLAAVFAPGLWIDAFVYPWYGGIGKGGDTVLNRSLFALAMTVSVFALVAAVSFLVRTPRGTARRKQARAFVAAFAFRDVGMVLFAVSAFVVGTAFGLGGFSLPDVVLLFLWPLSVTAMHVLLAWGILRTQILDIDLKVKWTVHRGTVAAGLAGVFFVVKEGIEALLPLDGVLPSIVGAAAIGLMVLPAWRLAGRVADRVMPGVEDTEAYRKARKRDIYRAAAEFAAADGRLTDGERDMLAVLAEELGLKPTEVRSLEREVASGGRA